jgi:hypothetical protein
MTDPPVVGAQRSDELAKLRDQISAICNDMRIRSSSDVVCVIFLTILE